MVVGDLEEWGCSGVIYIEPRGARRDLGRIGEMGWPPMFILQRLSSRVAHLPSSHFFEAGSCVVF